MKNVIITSFMGIGDTINLIPLAEHFSKKGINVYFLVYLKQSKEILKKNPFIKGVLLIPKEKSISKNILFSRRLRNKIKPKETFFISTYPHGPRREKFISLFYSAKKTIEINRKEGDCNLITNLSYFSKNKKYIKSKIFFSKEEKSWKDVFLKKKKIDKKDYIVAIHPGCNAEHQERRLPKEDYLEIMLKIIGEGRKKVFLFLGPAEINMKSFFEENLKEHLNKKIFLIIERNIRHSAIIMGRCNEYLGNDSAVMHFAEATGVKKIRAFILIDFFGNFPLGKRENAILNKEEFLRNFLNKNEGNKKIK